MTGAQSPNVRLITETTLSAARWAQAPRIVDFQYPLLIAHRGGANLGAENSLDAYKNSLTLGYMAVEAGDVQALSDGTLVVMHDATVDRTTTGTGNVNTFTRATWSALQIDVAGAWGGAYTNVPVPFWDDVLYALGGRCVIFPEVKDQLDSTATAMCDRLDTLGLRESTVIQSFNLTNLTIAAGRGYKTMYLGSTATGMIGALASARTAGVWSVGLDYTQSDVNATNVATIQAAGFRVFVYTLDHQANYAAQIANGVDGIFTNEGTYYVAGKTANYRKTQTTWHMTGRWEQGDLSNGDGPFSASIRGTLIGSVGAYRYKAGSGGKGMLVGTLCPVANAASTYTVTANIAIDTIPTTTTEGPVIYVAVPDDSMTGSTDLWNCYIVKARANGGVQMWESSATGTATSLGSATCTAFQNLTTTASLSGTITSLPVSALTVALKVGHKFLLPNGQIATVATAAIVGATSVTISSLGLVSTIASGSVLRPYISLVVTVTPTGISASRGDETSVSPVTSTDTQHRGGYLALSSTGYASGAVSYHKVSVT